jgi:hypothetical protein
LLVFKQRYPSGCTITVTPASVSISLLPTEDGISILAKDIPDDTLITVKAIKNEGPRSFVVNGKNMSAKGARFAFVSYSAAASFSTPMNLLIARPVVQNHLQKFPEDQPHHIT